MRMPGVNICVLNITAPALALFLVMSLASCGSSAEKEENAVKSRQPAAPERPQIVKFDGAREGASTHIIEIRNFKFVPDVIIAKKGDRILWKNIDVVPHTATAGDKQWDSGAIINEAEWSMTVDQAGVMDYICAYHPTMNAKLIVE